MIHRLLRNGYYRRCGHRSHRLHLPCYRGFVYDGYCRKHNTTCYSEHGEDTYPSAWKRPWCWIAGHSWELFIDGHGALCSRCGKITLRAEDVVA